MVKFSTNLNVVQSRGVPSNFVGGVQQIQLKTAGRENGDLGAVAPSSGVPLNLQMRETRILIRLLRMYFPRNREFGSALSKLRNFGGVRELNPPPLGTPLVQRLRMSRATPLLPLYAFVVGNSTFFSSSL
jgi:hypothetical protein